MSRGRLAQRESVCVLIQRSEFDSADGFSFASVPDEIRDFNYSKYSDKQKITGKKADFSLFFCGKKEHVDPNK